MALNRLRNKLESRKGFTLVEMVVTLAIVVLVTLVVGTGMAFAATEFARSMELSEAKVLQSTLSNTIGNELTATNAIHSASKTVTGSVGGKDHTVYTLGTYFSKSFGDNCELEPMKDGAPASYGQIYQVDSEGGGKQPLLSNSTYTRGLQASVSVEYADGPNEPVNGRFSVTIGIYNERGDLLIEDTVFDFIPYSKPDIDGEGGGGGGGHSGGGSSSSSSSGGSESSSSSSGGESSSSSSSSGAVDPNAPQPGDDVADQYSMRDAYGGWWQPPADYNAWFEVTSQDGKTILIAYPVQGWLQDKPRQSNAVEMVYYNGHFYVPMKRYPDGYTEAYRWFNSEGTEFNTSDFTDGQPHSYPGMEGGIVGLVWQLVE
jgi:prepilin-type N-terminal cleavage/methylation domain-containing protein